MTSNGNDTDIEAKLSYRPLSLNDVELVLAWRSNPMVYQHFRYQDGPLTWEDHLAWYESRQSERYDYIIEYEDRRVGSVFLTPDSFIGVYIGEVNLWGEGIGEAAVKWICTEHDRESVFAEIHGENEASRRLFENCGFSVHEQEGDWLIYRLNWGAGEGTA